MSDIKPFLHKALGFIVLILLFATITLSMQLWVGDNTIYSKELETQREEFHFGILKNEAPGGGNWAAVGGLSIQKRVAIVYFAEKIREYSGFSVGRIYKIIDTVFIFISFIFLYFYLRCWLPDIYCIVGILYLSAFLPLTYLFHVFHPWDRPQLAIWIILLYLVFSRKFLLLCGVLVLSVFVKFDTIMLPFLYLMVHLDRIGWLRTLIETLILFFLSFATYTMLSQLFPSPLDISNFNIDGALSILLKNISKFSSMNIKYPPLLMFLVPSFLSLFYLRFKDRFVLMSTVFGIGLSVIFALFSNYEEVRAQTMVLVLFMPSALISVMHMVNNGNLNYHETLK